MSTKAEDSTIEQLVTVFGFPRDRSREAVDAIGDKRDVQMAYNWLLDHGEEDRGGPVDIKICEHADHSAAGILEPMRVDQEAIKGGAHCSMGCPSGEVWMCLCCGEVRCSRYVNGHNLAHFKETLAADEASLTVEEASRGKTALGHFVAIGLRDLSIWCYHCSAYVTNPRLERLKKQVGIAKFGEPIDTIMEEEDEELGGTEKGGHMTGTPWKSMHGFKGDSAWAAPIIATVCHDEARPGYRTMRAHEYLDTPETLLAKVSLLASWIRKAKAAVIYSGAGISTAAGVKDYASVAADSIAVVGGGARKVHPVFGSPMKASPTLSHCVISQLHLAGLMPHWIQQNHDGLPQKAGFPQQHINEIHGSWFDVSNPVVPMSGTLREDLIKWLLEWEQKTDLCIAVGTSLCGMNADRVVTSAASRASSGGFGSVIISLQQTQLDSSASLRIFAKSDDVFRLLASELGVGTSSAALDDSILPSNDKFIGLPYDPKSGQRTPSVAGERTSLDLSVGSVVKVINQPGWDEKRNGNTALVVGKTTEGDYMLNFGGRVTRTLGRWWLIHALKKEVPFLPIVNA